MPIGSNAGGNLNIYLFEVGFLDVTDDTGNGQPFTVGIHPLLVAPRDVQYSDNSRSPVTQTVGGAVKTTSGRALRTCAMNGTFGINSRGLGPYIGNGNTRFIRFYNEVVRMGEALNNDDVNAAVDILRGTPLLPLILLPYDPDRHVPYINFYDFFSERQFSCTVARWGDSRHYDRGGASGLVHYQMTLQEEGPIVTGSLGSALIGALFAGLTTWSAINDVLESYTLGAIVESFAAIGDIVVSEFNETLAAVQGQLDSVTAIAGGFTPPTATSGSGTATGAADTEDLSAFFTNSQSLADQAGALIETVTASAPPTADNETGAVGWSDQEGEGGNAGLDTADQIDDLEDLADAALWQQSAGVLLGWDRDAFQSFITGRTEGGRSSDVRGSIDYTVGPTDTEASIELQFGVAWDRVLEVNNLTPDEALFEGRTLKIPRQRGRGSQTIEGLPTFGSHVGKEAWGTDLSTALDVDGAGRLVILREEEVLVQGVDWLLQVFGERLIPLINQVPEQVRDRTLSLQLERSLLSDRRIAGIENIGVEIDGGTGVAALSVTLSAINGGTLQTGGPRTSL